MAGTMMDSNGRNLIPQPAFSIDYALTNGDFDGSSTDQLFTDAAQTVPLLYKGKFPQKIRRKFGSGFVFRPDTTGDHKVLTYQAWRDNGCVVNDTLATTVYGATAGVWTEDRIIKLYQTGSASTNVNIGV
jgi:hypothetical protein